MTLPLSPGGDFQQAPAAENAGAVPATELLQRSEIQAALGGVPASAVRRVASTGNRRVLYAAAPVYAENGEISGIVYLATPLPPANLPSNAVLQLAAAILAAILLAGAAGVSLAPASPRPLETFAAPQAGWRRATWPSASRRKAVSASCTAWAKPSTT